MFKNTDIAQNLPEDLIWPTLQSEKKTFGPKILGSEKTLNLNLLKQQTAIQHNRWILQGGWKKKTAWLTLTLGSVIWIYQYTLGVFSSDTFYAELEMAENESRKLDGKAPAGYNISDPDDDQEFED